MSMLKPLLACAIALTVGAALVARGNAAYGFYGTGTVGEGLACAGRLLPGKDMPSKGSQIVFMNVQYPVILSPSSVILVARCAFDFVLVSPKDHLRVLHAPFRAKGHQRTV
jgi:hypothetical protein